MRNIHYGPNTICEICDIHWINHKSLTSSRCCNCLVRSYDCIWNKNDACLLINPWSSVIFPWRFPKRSCWYRVILVTMLVLMSSTESSSSKFCSCFGSILFSTLSNTTWNTEKAYFLLNIHSTILRCIPWLFVFN